MRLLLLVIVAVSTVNFARAGFDWWDYFSDENWWHNLRHRNTRIAEADCLLFRRRRPAQNVIPEATTDEITGIPLARNHIIPGNTLLRFFNTALEENGNNNNQLGGLLQILGALADNFMDYYEGNDEISGHVRNQLNTIRLIQLNYETGDEVSMNALFDSNNLARAIFYWMPANIFMGPRNRADDPGDNFENNANIIVENPIIFGLLRIIDHTMNLYIQNREVADFNQAIDLLQDHIFMGIREPYPFQINQWRARYMNGNGLHFYEINPEPTETTTLDLPSSDPGTVKKYFMKRDTVISKAVNNDPLCYLPIVTYEISLKEDNLMIAANVIERTNSGTGFKNKLNYRSWRDWLEASPWNDRFFIFFTADGIATYGKSMVNDKYGYIFIDKSFVVGVAGADLHLGNDSWTHNPGWDVSTLGGQMFFDKNGRPVALAVSDKNNSKERKGWLFVYSKERKWKQVPSIDIVKTLSLIFHKYETECLDATAMTFTVKNINVSRHDNKHDELKR